MFSVKTIPSIKVRTLSRFGIYIHWPFCKSKCPYCDFNSHVRDSIDQARWKNAMLQELRYYAAQTEGENVSSIFFGGGTPSLMPPDTMDALISEVHKLWSVEPDVEITMEANPTSTEAQKFIDFRRAGVNRVSIGVQSLEDQDLKALGREHSAAEAIKAIEIAANTFERYSFDLIYAREGQTLKRWENELTGALKHVTSHMSLYQLTIEKGTAFYTKFQRGDLIIPDDEQAVDFYNLTQDIMKAEGLPAYETSNHASAGEESRHNLTYWLYGQYVGIGAGAHGRILVDGQRIATRTHLAPESWLERVEKNGHGAHVPEVLSPREQAQEWLMMGLRLNQGVQIEACEKLTGYEFFDLVDMKQIEMLENLDFIEFRRLKGNLRVLNKGMLCLNSVLNKIING